MKNKEIATCQCVSSIRYEYDVNMWKIWDIRTKVKQAPCIKRNLFRSIKSVLMWVLMIRRNSAQISCLCRVRQVTDWDQTTTGKYTEWYQCLQSFSLSMAHTVFRRLLCPTLLKMTDGHTLITKSPTSNVMNSLQHGTRQTVRGFALRNGIEVASTHTILTEHVYDMWV